MHYQAKIQSLCILLYDGLIELANYTFSIALNDIMFNLYIKIELIILLLEAGCIQRNPGPNTINSPPSICTATLEIYAIKKVIY